jgi:hypothetical protein
VSVGVLEVVTRDVLDHVARRVEEEDRVRVPVAVVDDLGREAGGAVALRDRQERRPRLLPLEPLHDLVLGDVEGEVVERRPPVGGVGAVHEGEDRLAGFDAEPVGLLAEHAQLERLAVERLHRGLRRARAQLEGQEPWARRIG